MITELLEIFSRLRQEGNDFHLETFAESDILVSKIQKSDRKVVPLELDQFTNLTFKSR